jgi:GDPmannose 4,6-dehydratase
MGTLRLLELIRDLPKPPRFFHAASSEVFGRPKEVPQTEETPIAPVNPYGCAKAFALQMVNVYRDTFKLFACNGILYNHESPRRGENFVTRKICRAAAAIKLGLQKDLLLGETQSKRDWGYSPDYVWGMWLALQHQTAGNYIFATGELHSVQEVVEIAFETAQLDWKKFVRQDPRFMRPSEPHQLVGDSTKARNALGWKPSISFREMIVEMARAELNTLSSETPALHP